MYLRLSDTAQIDLPGAPAVTLAPRDAALLAWLAIEGPTSRDRLASLLWPASTDAQARTTLRQRLFKLRKQVGAEVAVGTRQLVLADGVGHDLQDANELLGDLVLQGAPEFNAWLEGRREQLRTSEREALQRQAQALEDAGDLSTALRVAQALLRLDPVSEAAHRHVIRLHYLRGEPAAALLAFDHCERMLKDEVGTLPSAETLALLHSIGRGALPGAGANMRPAAPAVVLRPPLLIGRAALWSALNAAWNVRSAAVVYGEPGMGKTRLLLDMACSRGDAVLITSRPGDARVPFSLLTRLVRGLVGRRSADLGSGVRRELARLLPELGEAEAMQNDADRARFVNAVTSLLAEAATDGLGGVIVDDLQYADAASAEMLQHLAGADDRLAWLAACRTAEVSARTESLIDELTRARRAQRYELQPLTDAQVGELLASLAIDGLSGAALAAEIARHTSGNPLYILETLKLMLTQDVAGLRRPGVLPVAGSVKALIEQRIGHLTPRAIRLARCAAVAGQDFSPELASHALGADALDLADPWLELERAQILRDGGFAHDLICEVVLASVPASIAGELHRAIARHLQAIGASAAHLAAHLEAGGDAAGAAARWVAAGREARAALRFAEAADAFERAAVLYARLSQRLDGFEAAALMLKACREIDLSERSACALQLLEQLASTPIHRAVASAERAETSAMKGDFAATREHAEAGLHELAGLADSTDATDGAQPLLRAQLRRSLAAVHVWRGETALALAALRAVQPDVERLGGPKQRFDLLQSLAIVLDHNDETVEALQRHHEAIALATSHGDVAGTAQSVLNLAIAQHDVGDMRAAQHTLERAAGLLAAIPDVQRSYSSFDFNQGLIARGRADYTHALDCFDRAIAQARRQTPGWLPLMVAHRAQALIFVGQHARAQQELDQAQPSVATPLLARTKWRAVRELLERTLGRDTDGVLETIVEELPRHGRRLTQWRLRAAMLARRGNAAAQLAQAEALLAEVRVAGRMGLVIHVAARAAALASALQRHDAATRHAREGLSLMRTLDADDAYPGEVLALFGSALAQAGAGEAQAVMARAVAWVRATAAARVPLEFRDRFVHRNPVNRRLLALQVALDADPAR